jgi:hypothetical protein
MSITLINSSKGIGEDLRGAAALWLQIAATTAVA